jgi:triosephosphate isomerase (TIM)
LTLIVFTLLKEKYSFMSKSIYLGFNWKVSPETVSQAKDLLQSYTSLNANFSYSVFVPFPYLGLLEGQNVSVGAQDVSANGTGAFTGQVTAAMLKDLGVQITLIGHSETRMENTLTNSTLNKKVAKSLSSGILPVLCTAFHNIDKGEAELTADLVANLQGINPNSPLIIAFEPLDSIGGAAMSADRVDHYLGFIKTLLTKNGFNQVKVLYGGGVNSGNIVELLNCPNLDGCLIGGASLKPDQIKQIFELTNQFVA